MKPTISIRSDVSKVTDVVALRETIQRFQRIFNGTGYGFWEWNVATGDLDWSGGFWERMGYDLENEPDIHHSDTIVRFMHPDDLQISHFALTNHLKHDAPYVASYRILKKNGEYLWTQVRGESIRDEHNRVIYMCGVNFDITPMKEAEEALRESEARQDRIIQSSNDGIWEWYADKGGFHFMSRCWELMGFNANDDEIVSAGDQLVKWRSHIHPQDLALFDKDLNDHLNHKKNFDIEYRLVGKDKQIYWVRSRGRASFDINGKPVRMSGANMDMTQIKRAEEKVLLAKEAAEKANHAKSDFLSSMSHELRTPLNAILGYAQLFEYDLNLTHQQIENMREIRKAGNHLLQLINDVLDLAKIESGKMTVSLEPVLMARVVQETLTLLQPQAVANGIHLYCSSHLNDSTYVTADNIRFKQTLTNLMSNAIKYNRMGGEVEVRWQQISPQIVRLSVRDNGIGIPIARQAEVFQPFNRLNAEYSKIEGSGVGLVITKQLVEMMNGKLDFSSVENQGTEFWVDLPVATQWHQSESQFGLSGAHAPSQLNFSSVKRVLYIEDNPTNIKLMQQFCEHHPCLKLDIAEEPFLAIYKARSTVPDLIILDINLPGMDGFDVINVIQQDAVMKKIPVVGLSANAMPYDIERGLKAGFYEYLTKPVDIGRLIATLNKIFG